MTLKRFSQDYSTFGGWLNAMPRTSRYASEIIRKHERFPTFSLSELRTLRVSDHDLSAVTWESLSPTQRRERVRAAEVARGMRKGERFSQALARTGARRAEVLKHLGKSIYKSRNYWRINKTDRIQAEMRFYERGVGHTSLVTANSRDRSKVGKYFGAVKKAIEKGDTSALNRFKGMNVVDANGVSHEFETDLDELYAIEDAQEEPEFLEIYQNGQG